MRTLFFLLSLLWISGLSAQQRDSRTREYLPPVRIVWQQDSALIRGSENLLQPGNGQSDLSNLKICKMSSTDQSHPAILLDFGRELQGGLQLVTGMPVARWFAAGNRNARIARADCRTYPLW